MKTHSAYMTKLKRMYNDIPEQDAAVAAELMQRLADVLVQMDECKAELEKNGCVVTQSRNGYEITKENPASKLYDAKHKLMLSTFAALNKLRPDGSSATDDLTDFLDSDAN